VAGRKSTHGDTVAGRAPRAHSPADRSSVRAPVGTALCTSHCSTAALSVRSPAGPRWPAAPLEGAIVPGPDAGEPTNDRDLVPGSARHPRMIEFPEQAADYS
jgi:hypothetical protein